MVCAMATCPSVAWAPGARAVAASSTSDGVFGMARTTASGCPSAAAMASVVRPRHRDHERVRREPGPQRLEHRPRALRLHADEHDVGAVHRLAVVGADVDAGEGGREFVQRVRVAPRGADLVRLEVAAAQQPADKRAPDVARADDGDGFACEHERLVGERRAD